MRDEPSEEKANKKLAWWVYILFACFVYIGLKYLLPLLLPQTAGMLKLTGLLAALAPLVTMLFLLLGAAALYRDDPEKSEEENITND